MSRGAPTATVRGKVVPGAKSSTCSAGVVFSGGGDWEAGVSGGGGCTSSGTDQVDRSSAGGGTWGSGSSFWHPTSRATRTATITDIYRMGCLAALYGGSPCQHSVLAGLGGVSRGPGRVAADDAPALRQTRASHHAPGTLRRENRGPDLRLETASSVQGRSADPPHLARANGVLLSSLTLLMRQLSAPGHTRSHTCPGGYQWPRSGFWAAPARP